MLKSERNALCVSPVIFVAVCSKATALSCTLSCRSRLVAERQTERMGCGSEDEDKRGNERKDKEGRTPWHKQSV